MTAKVTGNYSACESLMLSATKAHLCVAFMTWAGISSIEESPSWLGDIFSQKCPTAQWELLQVHIGKFVDEFVMTEFDIEKTWREQLEQRRKQRDQQRSSIGSSTTQILHADQAGNAQDARISGI